MSNNPDDRDHIGRYPDDEFYGKQYTDAKDKHKQSCPDCNIGLGCTADHYGGGSHYWRLICNQCRKQFVYDTYRNKLEHSTDLPTQPDNIEF